MGSAALAKSLQIYGTWWNSSKNLERAPEVIRKLLLIIFEQYWESREVLAVWKVVNIVRFSRRVRRIVVTADLLVSLQCLIKLWRRLLWELLKSTWKRRERRED